MGDKERLFGLLGKAGESTRVTVVGRMGCSGIIVIKGDDGLDEMALRGVDFDDRFSRLASDFLDQLLLNDLTGASSLTASFIRVVHNPLT